MYYSENVTVLTVNFLYLCTVSCIFNNFQHIMAPCTREL